MMREKRKRKRWKRKRWKRMRDEDEEEGGRKEEKEKEKKKKTEEESVPRESRLKLLIGANQKRERSKGQGCRFGHSLNCVQRQGT